VNLDVGVVFLADGDCGHETSFLTERGLHLCGGPGAGRLRLRAGTPLTITLWGGASRPW
jgi:hypothetical protein